MFILSFRVIQNAFSKNLRYAMFSVKFKLNFFNDLNNKMFAMKNLATLSCFYVRVIF